MNRKILQKVIDALKQDKKEYAMGILDTLIENEPEEKRMVMDGSPPVNIIPRIIPTRSETTDEGSMIEREAQAKLKNIDMSAIQTG